MRRVKPTKQIQTQFVAANVYEVEEFAFEPVTKEIWRKVKQTLSHETVTINGVGYVAGDSTRIAHWGFKLVIQQLP
jgi:hypothetical protein